MVLAHRPVLTLRSLVLKKYGYAMKEYNFKNLVLLIGTNPLPNYVTADFFLRINPNIRKIWLIYSKKNELQGGTFIYAENLEKLIAKKWKKERPTIEFPLEKIGLSDVSRAGAIQKESEKYQDYYLVVSGDMQNKKHDWLIKKAESGTKQTNEKDDKIPISDDDVQNYRNDSTKKKLKAIIDKGNTKEEEKEIPSILNLINLINLLDKELEKNTPEFEEVPCFYTLWKDEKENDRVSFGHTAMFRLAYEKSIKDHVPQNLTDDTGYDIAGAIFGNEKVRRLG
jgi:hypothetical protein